MLRIEEDILSFLVKGATAVDVAGLIRRSGFITTFLRVVAFITRLGELRTKKLIIIVLVELLQADNVGILGQYFAENDLLPYVPVQYAGWCVSILALGGVFVAENVVTESGQLFRLGCSSRCLL